MYPNFKNMPNYPIRNNYNDNRFVGGFVFPFLLGGVTGAALAPSFYRPYGYNTYNTYYPYYGPFYR